MEPGELCDPLTTCPQTCPMQGCTLLALVEAGTCLAHCMEAGQETRAGPTTAAAPAGCNAANDSDCAVVCGNGTIEGRETCDPLASCPQPARRRAAGCASWSTPAPAPRPASTPACRPPASRATAAARWAATTPTTATAPPCAATAWWRSGETCDPIASCMDRERACVSDAATTRTRMGDPGRCRSPAWRPPAPAARPTAPARPAAAPSRTATAPAAATASWRPARPAIRWPVCLERQQACVSDQSTVRTPGGDPGGLHLHLHARRPAPAARPMATAPPAARRPATPTAPAAATACWIPARPATRWRCASSGPPACVSDASTIRTPHGRSRHLPLHLPGDAADVRRRPTASARPAAAPPRTATAPGCGNGRVEAGRDLRPLPPRGRRAPASATPTPSAPPAAAPRPAPSPAPSCPGPARAATASAPACARGPPTPTAAPGPGEMCRAETRPAAPAAAWTGAAACRPAPSASLHRRGRHLRRHPRRPAGQRARARLRDPGDVRRPGQLRDAGVPGDRCGPREQDFGSVAVGSASTVFPSWWNPPASTAVTVGLRQPTRVHHRDQRLHRRRRSGQALHGGCRVPGRSRVARAGPAERRAGDGPADQLDAERDGADRPAGVEARARCSSSKVAGGDAAVHEGLTLTNVGTPRRRRSSSPTQPPFSVVQDRLPGAGPQSAAATWRCSSRPSRRASSWRPLQALGGNGVTATAQLQGAGSSSGQPLTITPSSHGFGAVIVGIRSASVPVHRPRPASTSIGHRGAHHQHGVRDRRERLPRQPGRGGHLHHHGGVHPGRCRRRQAGRSCRCPGARASSSASRSSYVASSRSCAHAGDVLSPAPHGVMRDRPAPAAGTRARSSAQ